MEEFTLEDYPPIMKLIQQRNSQLTSASQSQKNIASLCSPPIKTASSYVPTYVPSTYNMPSNTGGNLPALSSVSGYVPNIPNLTQYDHPKPTYTLGYEGNSFSQPVSTNIQFKYESGVSGMSGVGQSKNG